MYNNDCVFKSRKVHKEKWGSLTGWNLLTWVESRITMKKNSEHAPKIIRRKKLLKEFKLWTFLQFMLRNKFHYLTLKVSELFNEFSESFCSYFDVIGNKVNDMEGDNLLLIKLALECHQDETFSRWKVEKKNTCASKTHLKQRHLRGIFADKIDKRNIYFAENVSWLKKLKDINELTFVLRFK